MNHQDKFWQVFQDKVKSYSTDEYSPTEWEAMEELLATEPTATSASDNSKVPAPAKVWWKWWVPAILLLLAVGAFLWTLPTEPTVLSHQQVETPATAKQAEPASQAPRPESATALATATTTARNAPDRMEQSARITLVPLPGHTAQQASATDSAPPERAALAAEESTANVPSSSPSLAGQEATASPAATTAAPMTMTTSAGSTASATVPPSEQPITTRTSTNARTNVTAVASIATIPMAPLAPLAQQAFPVAECAPDHFSKRWRPSLIIGANLLPTNTGRSRQMAGGLMGGLAIGRSLSPRWYVEVEAVARAVLNYDLTLEVSDTYIDPTGGAEQSHEETRTIRDYLSVDFPVVFHYATNSRWSLTTGLRYSYLTPIQTFSTSSFQGISENVLARVNQPQIWQNDFGLLVGVAYELSPRWSIQARFTQSWVDLSPDNLYQERKTHLNSDLQITTRKYF